MLPLCKLRANAHSHSELWVDATCRGAGGASGGRGAKANDRSTEPSGRKAKQSQCLLRIARFYFYLFFFCFLTIFDYGIPTTFSFRFCHSASRTHTHTHMLSSLLIYITNCARIKLHAMRRIFFFSFIALSLAFTVLHCPNQATKCIRYKIGPKQQQNESKQIKHIHNIYSVHACIGVCVCVCIR